MRSPRFDVTSVPNPPTSTAEPVSTQARSARPGAGLLGLQRRLGNRRARGIIQAKLNVGPADDRFEREADRLSRLATGSAVQRAPEMVQRVHGAAGGVADPGVADAVARARGGGRAVPGGVRERMERVSGADFGDVRVHVGAESDRLNEALGSRAFTVGADVFVRRSEYRPGTARGDALLGHELTHTIQQGAASSSTAPCAPAVGTPTVQRLFGFELELAVPVLSKRSKSRLRGYGRQYEAEGYPEMTGPEIATANDGSFVVHVDHDDGLNSIVPVGVRRGLKTGLTPIIELVTRPMNEATESKEQVSGVMRNLVDVANHINAHALQQNASIPVDGLPGVTAIPAGVNHIGYPARPGERAKLSVGAHMQATFGVSLRKVGEEFASHATANTDLQRGWLYKRSKKLLGEANKIADAMVVYVRDMAAGDLENEDGYGTVDELRAAHGLFSLIAYYLVVGGLEIPKEMSVPLLKNRFGIFYYKTRLSTVRNELASDPALGDLFTNHVDELVGQLLLLSKRDIFGPVVRGAVVLGKGSKKSVSCLEWVESVLKGEEDQIFESTANTDLEDNARELRADDVGQGSSRGVGVVMENRRFNETRGKTIPYRVPPAAWPGLAADLHDYLNNRQGT